MKLPLVAAAIALAIPITALAAEGRDKPSFPMAGEAFLDMVEERLDRMEERIDARLAESDKSDADKEKIRQRFEDQSSKVMDAAQKAAADGTVTKDEAKAVHAHARKGKRHHGAERDKLSFPMEGKAFVSHVEARQKAMAAKVEKRLANAKLDDAKKVEIKARFNERSAAVLAAAKAAAADGTVTKDEAKAMHKRGKNGKGAGKGQRGKNKPGKGQRNKS